MENVEASLARLHDRPSTSNDASKQSAPDAPAQSSLGAAATKPPPQVASAAITRPVISSTLPVPLIRAYRGAPTSPEAAH